MPVMRRFGSAAAVLAAVLALAPPARAHGGWLDGSAALEQAPVWMSQALFVAAWLAYAWGAMRVRPAWRRRLAFNAAMLVAGAALFGPLDRWAESSIAMHMVQHMLLIAVVAPLLVLAAPMRQWRAACGRLLDPPWRLLLRASRHPMACAALHAAALWVWHAPQPYRAAVLNPGWHVAAHACFLFSAWLFWWAVLRPGQQGVLGAVLALLLTAIHTGMLGALLTFAPEPLYGRPASELWDQQLAGLLMWIPGGMAYLLAAGWLVHRAAVHSEVSTPTAYS